MIRTQHKVAGWLALAVLAGCSRPQPPRDERGGAPPSPPGALAHPAAAADAAAPNRVLDPAGWSDVRVRNAYAAARKYAHVLEKLYCYCRCKENIGHRALVECFESDHGSMCDVCMTEALMAARLTEQGRTPAEIQKAIDAYYG
jgi:hypothetical protein